MNLFNLNFNFNFKNCFKSNNNKQDNNLSNFMKTLNTIQNKEIKIEMLLQKITNGKFDLSILYKTDENNLFNLRYFYGNLNIEKTTYYNLLSTPIFINGKLEWFLMVMNIKKSKIVVNEELIEILRGVLSI